LSDIRQPDVLSHPVRGRTTACVPGFYLGVRPEWTYASSSLKSCSVGGGDLPNMATTHEELLEAIKIAIDRLASDQSVPQKQTIRELVNVREYIGSAIELMRRETNQRINNLG
jgi:hypothetical protein